MYIRGFDQTTKEFTMSLETTMRAAFAGVNAYSPDDIMKVWNPDGVYDNPSTGPAAKGYDAVRGCMVKLCDGVKSRETNSSSSTA